MYILYYYPYKSVAASRVNDVMLFYNENTVAFLIELLRDRIKLLLYLILITNYIDLFIYLSINDYEFYYLFRNYLYLRLI